MDAPSSATTIGATTLTSIGDSSVSNVPQWQNGQGPSATTIASTQATTVTQSQSEIGPGTSVTNADGTSFTVDDSSLPRLQFQDSSVSQIQLQNQTQSPTRQDSRFSRQSTSDDHIPQVQGRALQLPQVSNATIGFNNAIHQQELNLSRSNTNRSDRPDYSNRPIKSFRPIDPDKDFAEGRDPDFFSEAFWSKRLAVAFGGRIILFTILALVFVLIDSKNIGMSFIFLVFSMALGCIWYQRAGRLAVINREKWEEERRARGERSGGSPRSPNSPTSESNSYRIGPSRANSDRDLGAIGLGHIRHTNSARSPIMGRNSKSNLKKSNSTSSLRLSKKGGPPNTTTNVEQPIHLSWDASTASVANLPPNQGSNRAIVADTRDVVTLEKIKVAQEKGNFEDVD